jgi:hypothetical protein
MATKTLRIRTRRIRVGRACLPTILCLHRPSADVGTHLHSEPNGGQACPPYIKKAVICIYGNGNLRDYSSCFESPRAKMLAT